MLSAAFSRFPWHGNGGFVLIKVVKDVVKHVVKIWYESRNQHLDICVNPVNLANILIYGQPPLFELGWKL